MLGSEHESHSGREGDFVYVVASCQHVVVDKGQQIDVTFRGWMALDMNKVHLICLAAATLLQRAGKSCMPEGTKYAGDCGICHAFHACSPQAFVQLQHKYCSHRVSVFRYMKVHRMLRTH